MTNFILALRTMLSIIPEILAAIRAIELPGNGVAKASAIIAIVAEAFAALPEELKNIIDANKFGAYVKKVIDILVGFLNGVGALGSSKVS